MLKGTVYAHICSPPDDVYFKEGLVYFSRTMQNQILQLFTTAWLRSRRVRMLNWPACNPDLSPIENIWCIIKQNMSKTTTNSSADGNLYQAIMGPNSNTP